MSCPACNYEGNEPMGRLGSRVHFRCRACGMMYSHEDSRTDARGNWKRPTKHRPKKGTAK